MKQEVGFARAQERREKTRIKTFITKERRDMTRKSEPMPIPRSAETKQGGMRLCRDPGKNRQDQEK
jgi:hypothetical protein